MKNYKQSVAFDVIIEIFECVEAGKDLSASGIWETLERIDAPDIEKQYLQEHIHEILKFIDTLR